jgi:intracellular septation protein A
MKDFLRAGAFFLEDLASTLLFLVLYLYLGNLMLAVGAGVAFGLAQVGWQLARRRRPDAMQLTSLVLVLVSGAATLLTRDPRFILLKPSVVYVIVGVVMLRPGWMKRYMPPVAHEVVPDLIIIFGFIWAGLMFVSAAVNVAVALNFTLIAWAAFMATYAMVSKFTLFLIQFTLMKLIGRQRHRRRLSGAVSA